MKHLALLSVLACSIQALHAAPITPCNGNYEASQKWLAALGGPTIQGGRSLGTVQIKVLDCGNKINLSADGLSIQLSRSPANSNTFKGSRAGTPNLDFTLEATTAHHIKGKMIASDGELTLKRPLAIILQSGSAPKFDSCSQNDKNPKDLNQDALSLIKLFEQLKLSPADNFEYADYMHINTWEDKKKSSITLYLDAKNRMLPIIKKKNLNQASCSGNKKQRFSRPVTKITFITQRQAEKVELTLKISQTSNPSKILQEQKSQISQSTVDTTIVAMTKAMTDTWNKLDPSIDIVEMSNGKHL